jgi:streptomycin 6-kinase
MPKLSMGAKFERNVIDVHGDAGARWLRSLPDLIASFEQRWSLTAGDPFGLSYNYVTRVTQADDTPAVLKLCVPGDREFITEIATLRAFDGQGAVRLLNADVDQAVMLIEHLQPGAALSSLEDSRATSAAASVMRRLWRPAPSDQAFPHIADWAAGLRRLRERFGGGTGPLPADVFAEAELLFEQLIKTMATPVLLHGDLHHGNILSAQRDSWLAIDPKGLIGEPACETGALLRNPMPELLMAQNPRQILERRLDQLADELELDRSRIGGWALAQAVLSAAWSVEDHGRGWEPAIACARLLSTIKP